LSTKFMKFMSFKNLYIMYVTCYECYKLDRQTLYSLGLYWQIEVTIERINAFIKIIGEGHWHKLTKEWPVPSLQVIAIETMCVNGGLSNC